MRRSITSLLFAALLAAGCQTPVVTNVREGRAFDDLNDRLFDLYQAKVAMGDDGGVAFDEDVQSRLSDLATAASEQAALATDARDQIGFYRIAAVAAWQARSGEVVDIAEAGLGLCNGAASGWNVAPRDCGLIAVAPDMAVADDAALQVREIQGEFSDGRPIPAEREDAIIGLIELMLSRHTRLAQTRAKVATSDAPEAFALRLASDLDDVACNADTAWNVLARVQDVDQERFDTLKDRIDERTPEAGCD